MQDALATLMHNRTSFVIAHRLSTVMRADAIVVLEKGHVREIGRHEELLARPDSVYAKLYALQVLGFDGDRLRTLTAFLDPRVFAAFDLPQTLGDDARDEDARPRGRPELP